MTGKQSRTDEVNQALAARRKLMEKRILRGRIALIVWAVAAIVNLVFLFGSDELRLFLSCTSADFCVMYHFLNPDLPGSVCLLIPAFLLPVGMIVAAILWKRDGVGNWLRTGSFLLLWLDVILGLSAYFWNPAVLFGDHKLQTVVAISNLLAHIGLVWMISRARRAVESLEILPESEYEGDPYEAFRNKSE